MQITRRSFSVFFCLLLAFLSLGVATYSMPKAHADATQNAQIQHPWTDALSGGMWARLNNFGRNSSILDSAQAQAALGLLSPSGSSSQPPPSMFTNNFRVTTNSSLFPLEDEPSIAVRNQTGQVLMVVGANSLSNGLMVSYVSADQGTHWQGPTYLSLSNSTDGFASDPALAVDHRGTFYYSFLSIGSFFFFSSGGQDDVVVATSSDGVHWTNHVAVQRRALSSNSNIRSELYDKEYMAVGPSKTNPAVDAVYVTYTDFIDYCAPFPSNGCQENSTIMQVHSIDSGVTWSKPVAVSPSVTITRSFFQSTAGRLVQGSMPAIAPNGDVYVAYYDSGKDGWLNASATIMFARSTDGGVTFLPPLQAALIPQQLTFASQGNFCCFRWWSSMFPSIDVSPDGTVYIAYGARQSKVSVDPADVFLVASTDGGSTWSQPNKINDDSTQNAQFFAWLKVSADGVVHIIWGDMRLDQVGIGYDIFYAEATNYGAIISHNSRVTDVGTDPLYTIGFVGDYFNMAVSGKQVYPVWTDGRRGIRPIGRYIGFGETDIFTARFGPRDTPSIALGNNTPAGYAATVQVSGSGLPRDAFFIMKMNGLRLLSQKTSISFFFSDETGRLSDIITPTANYYGAYSVELDEWVSGGQLAATTLYIVNTQSLQVSITGPMIAFPGDSVTWNLQIVSPVSTISQQGISSTMSITGALLTSPSGSVQDLTGNVQHAGANSYSLSTTLPTNAVPGSYSLLVTASQAGLVVQSSGSGSATLTVYNRATSISVACNPNPAQVGHATTCSASVTDIAPGSAPTPTGTVSWTSSDSGSFSSTTCTLSGSGVSATCSVNYTARSAGSQIVTGTYGGDVAQPTAAQPTTLVVGVGSNGSNSLLIMTISCNPTPVQVSQAATCSALVTDIAPGSATTPTGTVSWTSSGSGSFSSATCSLSGSGVSATCSVDYTAHAAGSQVIKGTYGGDTVQPPAAQPTTLVVQAPANNSSSNSLMLGAFTGGAGVIGVAAGAAIGLFAMRRKKPTAPGN